MRHQAWYPGASLDVLRKAALLRKLIRQYMDTQGVLEVVTPALSAAAATDPNIHSFQVGNTYLHTSPEFPMKRLLAAYGVDIYQIASVFRDGEAGRNHNAEFSLLEWYRVGIDHHALMNDVSELLERLVTQFGKPWQHPVQIRYTDAVSAVCEKPFGEIHADDIERVFSQHDRSYPSAIGNDVDAALDLLVDEFVVSGFADTGITFLIDYPASQAALARVAQDASGLAIAERFEVFWGKLELANGFHELTDANEQRLRFERDLEIRQQRETVLVPVDENLLDAMSAGLPDCAGVALGLDRVLLALSDATHIDEVIAFTGSRA